MSNGSNLERKLKSIVNTSKDIHREAINSNDFTHPHGEPPESMEGNIFVLVGGKEPKHPTELDYDVAINIPSRLEEKQGKPPQKVVELDITMDSVGDIVDWSKIGEWDNKELMKKVYQHRFSGEELNDVLRAKKELKEEMV